VHNTIDPPSDVSIISSNTSERVEKLVLLGEEIEEKEEFENHIN